MSRASLILLIIAVGAAAFWWRGDSDPQSTSSTTRDGVTRHAFLEGRDLSGSDYALLLHPLATGGEPRAVIDPEALRAAQDTAFYTNMPNAELKRILLSVVFLSPPTSPTSNLFVSVIKGKEIEEDFKCYAAYCTGAADLDPPHERDLAGLLAASVPVQRVDETFAHNDKARAAHFRLLRDADVIQIDPPQLPPPGTVDYPHRVVLTLPAILRETDDSGRMPKEPFDLAELEARFQAAFAHAYPKTGEYRLGALRVTEYYPPQNGWPIVSEGFDGYLRDEDGVMTGLNGIMVIEPSVSIDLYGAMNTALRAPDAFAEMPEFLPPEPASVEARLDAMAEAHSARPCPGCFKIELPVTTVDDIHVRPAKPIPYTLSYVRILRE